MSDEGDDSIGSLPGVPCSEPHDNEVFAVFDLEMETFPGDEMSQIAFDACVERFRVVRRHGLSVLDPGTS